jgi:hypothetical protein
MDEYCVGSHDKKDSRCGVVALELHAATDQFLDEPLLRQ